MRDAWFALTWMLLLPMTVMSAHVGVLLWIWVALMSPGEVLYGAMAGVPFNRVVAITTMISLPFNMEKKEFYLDKLSILILLFTISATISWLTALVPGADTDALYQKLVKEIVLFFAITSVMITRHRIHLVLIILTIYQFSRHSQSFGNGRARSISLTAVRRPRVNQDSLLLASFLG